MRTGWKRTALGVFAVCLLLLLLVRLGFKLLRASGGHVPKERTFTRTELAKYKGEDGGPIYLAVAGHVFDVSTGRNHYGPGRGYSGFAGRDASRSFADMCFTPKCLEVAHIIDDTMTAEQKNAVQDWLKFYQTEKAEDGTIKYPYLGRVVDD